MKIPQSRFPLLVLAAVAAWPASAQNSTPNALDIVKRSLDRDFQNFEDQKNYTYQQREQNREFDAKGSVTKTEVSTNEVMILAGRPYERLVARDDKPLPEKDARREQEKMDRELAKRMNMSDAERAQMEKKREENRKFLRELPDAFNFTLIGEDTVSGKPAWVIGCDPKPGYQPKTLQGKFLSRVRAKLWVDQNEYQWVKADAEVLDTISFGMALFRISPGGVIHFEQTRVNDDVWLPSRVQIRADARLAYIKKMRTEIDITYRDYKKFQTEARIVRVEEEK
jgi:hypothetical protein